MKDFRVTPTIYHLHKKRKMFNIKSNVYKRKISKALKKLHKQIEMESRPKQNVDREKFFNSLANLKKNSIGAEEEIVQRQLNDISLQYHDIPEHAMNENNTKMDRSLNRKQIKPSPSEQTYSKNHNLSHQSSKNYLVSYSSLSVGKGRNSQVISNSKLRSKRERNFEKYNQQISNSVKK
jgi:hypothetical protein